MKVSARNTFRGKITQVRLGPVSAEITLNVAPGVDVVSVISASSAESLGLAVGKQAFALIKASSVMIGVDHA